MRDIAILLVVLAGALSALRHPWIGAMMWTWVSIMSPHQEFGYSAATWPVAILVAACTLVGMAMTPNRHTPFVGPPVWWILAFVIWICITLPFSMYFSQSLDLWIRSMKIFFMLFVTIAVIENRRQIEVFVWVLVLSLGFYGVKGGVFTIATGGNFRVWGPGGFIQGNNEIALALVMTIPLMRYLQLQLQKRAARIAMGLAMLLTALTVLGTYSRGALLALSSMALVLWIKGKNKVLYGIALVTMALVALPFMPEQWWSRMETIKTYEEDASALGRINAWWNAWNLASDKPFGGGFMIYTPEVFARYSPEPERVHAAHSIYFQVLGEHGFIGLFLFLAIGVSTWRCCSKLIRLGRSDDRQRWAGDLGGMIQVSLVGYAVGGAFLSLAYFDLPYDLAAAAALSLYVIQREPVRVPAVANRSVRPA
jgi:putative inorganic carbon (hco3(-)) transporter